MGFLRRFVAYLAERMSTPTVVSEGPAAFLAGIQAAVAVDAKTLRWDTCARSCLQPTCYCIRNAGRLARLGFRMGVLPAFRGYAAMGNLQFTATYWQTIAFAAAATLKCTTVLHGSVRMLNSA